MGFGLCFRFLWERFYCNKKKVNKPFAGVCGAVAVVVLENINWAALWRGMDSDVMEHPLASH